jgi:hypothetical protein
MTPCGMTNTPKLEAGDAGDARDNSALARRPAKEWARCSAGSRRTLLAQEETAAGCTHDSSTREMRIVGGSRQTELILFEPIDKLPQFASRYKPTLAPSDETTEPCVSPGAAFQRPPKQRCAVLPGLPRLPRPPGSGSDLLTEAAHRGGRRQGDRAPNPTASLARGLPKQTTGA